MQGGEPQRINGRRLTPVWTMCTPPLGRTKAPRRRLRRDVVAVRYMPTPRASADRHSLAVPRNNLSATPAHSHRVSPRHAAPLPHLHEPPEATSLFVILIPIIAGRALHATRAPCAGLDPKFRSALPRRLFPLETLDRSRFPKLHSGPSNPAVTPLSERRTNLTDTSGVRQSPKEKEHGTAHHQNPGRRPQFHRAHPRVLAAESLVCITLDANRVGATLRVDLPTHEGGLRYARTVADYLAHDASAASVLFAVYTSEPQKPGRPNRMQQPSQH
jgi:hypothetical protein